MLANAGRMTLLAVVVVVSLAFAVVGSGAAPVPVGPSATSEADLVGCAAAVGATVGQIGRRTYENDLLGPNAAVSRQRVAHSKALGDAVGRGDAARAIKIMQSLRYAQITRIRVYRGSSLLAELGRSPALAPVSGRLTDSRGRVVGRFVLAIQDDRGFAAVTGAGAAAQVLIREGQRQVAGLLAPGPAVIPVRGPVTYNGRTYQAYSFAGRSLTGAALRISFLVPPEGVARNCGPTPEATILNTIAAVSVQIYYHELLGRQSQAVRDIIARSPSMLSAVGQASPVAVRTQIVRLFRTHLHIVRVRVSTRNGRLINDVGGPAVLAPARGDFRAPDGRVIGYFLFSLQDDAGYMKLVRAFTGAQVLMRVDGRQVAGTLDPGPPNPPDYGPVHYGGVLYYCYSFSATAFPDRPMRISILIRPEQYA